MSNAPSPLWSIERTAEHLDCSRDTIRRMISRGELPARRFGRLIRIDPADLRKASKPITNAADLRGGGGVA